ncbi:hypothetical protein MHM86_15900 [Thalassobius sp. Cn5-15]|nr:hypothetical protein [Thalassobius sp. Cn5-15]
MPWIMDTIAGAVAHDISGRIVTDLPWERQPGYFKAPSKEDLPLDIQLSDAPKILPEFCSLADGNHFVGDKARGVLEEFCPGMLSFHAVRLGMPNKKLYKNKVYLLTMGDACLVEDGIVLEGSDIILKRPRIPLADGGSVEGPPMLGVMKRPPRLYWSRVAVGERHLWADSKLQQIVVASDALHEAFKARGVTGYQAQECRFVQEH